MVFDAKLDVLAWNPMAAAPIGDFAAVPGAGRNLILRYFSDPSARDRHSAEDAWRFEREAVALLRAASARYPRDPGVAGLVRRLLAIEEFAALWATHDVSTGLHVPESDQWVVFHTATPGSPSAEALRLLKVVGTQDLTCPERAEAERAESGT